jgi:hypothetical protein
MYDPEAQKALRSAGRLGTLGMEISALIIGFLLGGYWLDKKLGSSPYLTLAGVFMGAFGSFWAVYQAIKQSEVKERAKSDEGPS